MEVWIAGFDRSVMDTPVWERTCKADCAWPFHRLPTVALSVCRTGSEGEPVGSSQGAVPQGPEATSSSSLASAGGGESLVEPAVSQSDTENRDPSSHAEPGVAPRRRGQPPHRFLGKKYRKYAGRR